MAKRKIHKGTGRITDENYNTRQLKRYIREQTALAEERIKTLTEGQRKVGGLEKFIQKIKKAAGVKAKKGKMFGLGLSRKNKKQLLKQARVLQQFGTFALDKMENIERTRKAFESFHKRHPEIGFEEWQNMVEDLNTKGNELFAHPFEGLRVDTNIIRMWETMQAQTGKKLDLIQALDETYNDIAELRETKGEDWEPDKKDYINMVYRHLQEQLRKSGY